MSEENRLWYKDAIIYEVHVRAFFDSVGDGHGDFRGLTQKLDYLQDLGVTAIWLLPFYPSPLRDDGYDIADYTQIHPQYGKLDDFKNLLEVAHDRGIRVITELVLNHTSDQHPWFQRARYAPAGSPERDFYVWSDSPEKYKEARVIFQDFEPSNWSWDPVANSYFWHRFYSHQPDLNFDNPAVRQAILPILDFWLEMGVDGLRLDAIPYLFEQEGTNCENLPKTHQFLKSLREHVDKNYPGRMFLAEANQWPEDAVAYFGEGDECHMAFHFPLMPRLFMALHQEDRFPIQDILAQTPAIPETCQWCMFLRNHDELTLEMVTDEERDYMYRAYARDNNARINLGIRHRLAPLLRNDRRRIELMFALLFSMPGTPVIYYGDEIGMGDNIYLGDRNGVRTPMQWSADRNAGFSRANPQRLYLPVVIDSEYHFETVNVEAQQGNSSSLLWWIKRLVTLRKSFLAFGRGSFRMLSPENTKVLAFIREFQDERVLVVANLSRFVQYVKLDLKDYAGCIPEELFGRTRFPQVMETPYVLTIGPHGFIWFSLTPQPIPALENSEPHDAVKDQIPVLQTKRKISTRFQPSHWEEIEAILPNYLRRNKLISGRSLRKCKIVSVAPIQVGEFTVWHLIVLADVVGEISESISLGLTFIREDQIAQLLMPREMAGFAEISGSEPGVLCDALAVPGCCRAMLRGILAGRSQSVEDGEIEAAPLPGLDEVDLDAIEDLPLTLRRSDRINSTIFYGDSFLLKMFRTVEHGINPGLEIGRYLATKTNDHGVAPVMGSIEYRRRGTEPITLGVLRRFVKNHGTAWQYTVDQLSQFFERTAALAPGEIQTPLLPALKREGQRTEMQTDPWQEMVGGYRESACRLGLRTADAHRALSANTADPAFAPEPFGKLYQRSLYQSLRNLTGRLCERMDHVRDDIPQSARPLADQIVTNKETIIQRFRAILDPSFVGQRIRCHGDYHLGQLLFTGMDFVIIDLEGDTTRPIGERRIKRSPLRDVASMIRSLDYAVQSVLLGLTDVRGRSPGVIRSEDRAALETWASRWYEYVTGDFLSAYLKALHPTAMLPESLTASYRLLELFCLEKALLEIDADLTERPDWVEIPLRGAVRLLSHDPADASLHL